MALFYIYIIGSAYTSVGRVYFQQYFVFVRALDVDNKMRNEFMQILGVRNNNGFYFSN